MKISVNRKSIVKYCVALLIALIIIVLNKSMESAYTVSWMILLISGINLISHSHNWNSFIVTAFMFWVNYSVCIANMIAPIEDSSFTAFRNDPIIIIGMDILFVFNLGMLVILPKYKHKDINFFSTADNNKTIYYLTCIVLVLILFFGFGRPALGERGSPSTLYEYSIILFIVGLQFSKKRHGFMILLMFLFSLQNLIYGGRVTALQMIIAFFLIFWGHKAKKILIIPVVIVGLVLMTIVGELRGAGLITIGAVQSVIGILQRNKLCLDTAYAAYFASLCIAKVESVVAWPERIRLFGLFIINLIFGQSISGNYNLSNYALQYYRHSGGGFLPFYFHFYMGWMGVLLLLLALVWIFKRLYRRNYRENGFSICLKTYFACTVPRWYLYSPQPIFRGLIICAIVYVIYDIGNQLIKRKTPKLIIKRGQKQKYETTFNI